MKNRSLFILLAAVLPLLSCGTMSYSALQGGEQFRNSIYYTPGSRTYTTHSQVEKNAGETPQQLQSGEQEDVRNVYVGEADEVNIKYEPGATYAIIDDDGSYAARLRKFDSPSYTINIEFVEPFYWYDVSFGWRTPWWSNRYAWYGPGWYWHIPSWHWDSYWHNPWYDHIWGRPYWAWHNPWHHPWWGHHHHPVYAPWPGHGHIGGPGYAPGHGRPGRDVYYGKRNAGSTYNNVNRGSVTSGRQNANTGKSSQGSVTRRPARNHSSGEVKSQQSQSVERNNSSYTRSSGNSYNRSGSSSYSSGRSGNSSSGTTRSSGGGSSYRRR